MGKSSKTGRILEIDSALYSKTAKFEISKLFPKKNFDTGFEISFVGTMNIS